LKTPPFPTQVNARTAAGMTADKTVETVAILKDSNFLLAIPELTMI